MLFSVISDYPLETEPSRSKADSTNAAGALNQAGVSN